MRHILLIFHHYRSPKDLGGLRSWHVGSHLAKRGFRVTAVVPGVDTLTGKKAHLLKGKLWYSEVIDRVTVVRVNATKNDRTSILHRSFYYLSYSILQVLASLFIRKVDLIISTSMPLPSVLFAYIQSKIRRVPFVIDVRDLAMDAAVELAYFSRNVIMRLVLNIENWLFKKSDYLIPVSDGMGSLLTEKGVPSDKIEVIPIGYDGKDVYEKCTDWSRDIKSEMNLTGKFVVLYAGTMGHVIDIPTVLNAAQETIHMEDIIYVFIGGGQRLKEYIKDAAINKLNCRFIGPRPKSDIPLFCSQADLCVYPLKGEKVVATLLGNKIFDYLGNGTPTIYSGPEGDVKRLIQCSGGGICVPSGNGKALSEAIINLYDDPGKIGSLGENAALFIDKYYNVKKMMNNFEQALMPLLK